MTEQDPLAPPAGDDAALALDDAILVDPLSDAALAAMLAEPYEAGLRSALDDGVAAALPGVARELAYLDRSVAATQGRLAGLAAAPVAAVPVPDVAGFAPASPMVWGEGGAVTAAAEGLMQVERVAAAEGLMRAAEPVLPEAAPAAREGAAADVAPGFGRMAWGGVDWGRLAGVPGVAPTPEPPAVMAPLTVAGAMAEVAAAPVLPAAAAQVWPSWSAAPVGEQAMPSAAPVGEQAMPSAAPVGEQAMPSAAPVGREGAWAGDAADWSSGGRGAVAAAMPEQAAHDDAEYAPGGEAGGGEAGGGEAADGRAPGLGGVLKVDGALLGRFIAEQLGREAGRPPSGMTGFDPLVSPAWMSAYQG